MGFRRWVAVGSVVALVAASVLFVYATGGIKYVFSHSMYLPILIASAMFGPIGGLAAGVVGGLGLGPWMPIDTQTGEMQELVNWLFRCAFFMLIGGSMGGLVDSVAFFLGRDPLSGIPSKVPLRVHLGRLIERQRRGELAPFSFLVFRIDNYSEVSATFGTETGQALVRGLVDRLDTTLRGGSSRIFHVHGEQFGTVVAEDEARSLSEEIRVQIRAPVSANGVPVYVGLTIGRASCPDHGQDADSLVQHAVLATQMAESASGNGAGDPPGGDEGVYDFQLHEAHRQNLLLISSLGEAIAGGQLRLHYQPLIRLASHRVAGVEALVRWQHPDYGLVPPARFVPQAEKTPLIHDLTAWVLHSSLQDARRFRDRGDDWRVNVNVSARDLGDRELLPTIDRLVGAGGIEPSYLEVEVTESAVLEDPERAVDVLRRLRDRGLTVAIDDFGAGATSIGLLRRLPANRLKLDRGLVGRLVADGASRHIVECIVLMAHRLGMESVAEGIEDAATLRTVEQLGCDIAQGFFISHPKPAPELEGFVFAMS